MKRLFFAAMLLAALQLCAQTKWHSGTRRDFAVAGRDAILVTPAEPIEGNPWVWRPAFFDAFPQIDIELLERGYHIAYFDVTNEWGRPEALAAAREFYDEMQRAGLSPRPVMEGLSRGGYFSLRWAQTNPDRVACLLLDNPLVDLFALAQNAEWYADFLSKYHLEEASRETFSDNAVLNLDRIAEARIPVVLLSGALDTIVPYADHGRFVKEACDRLCSPIVSIMRPGGGHHPHGLDNPAPVADYITRAFYHRDALVEEARDWLECDCEVAPLVAGPRRYDSYKGLVMAGYQGWHDAPGDGSGRGWYHYKGHDGFRPGSTNVDLWPEVDEYEVTYPSPFTFDDGSVARLISAHDPSTVDTHFRWMEEYGLDGVFLQRFVGEISNPSGKNHFNKVLDSAMRAANAHGRAVAVMYDLSGMRPGGEQTLLADIDEIASAYSLFDHDANPSYLYHNGRPLVTVWGVGFNDHRRYGLKEANIIVDGLKEKGFSVMLGVPTWWEQLKSDTEPDPGLHAVIEKCDIVMPWFVGRYDQKEYPKFKKLIKNNIRWAKSHGVDYAPLCFPGFSWKNMHQGRPTKDVPRNGGTFFWDQLSNVIASGAEMIYIAMFDEIDEGTAIYKCAHRVPTPAPNSTFLPIEDSVPSDHYLWLAGRAALTLRGELPLSKTLPTRRQ